MRAKITCSDGKVKMDEIDEIIDEVSASASRLMSMNERTFRCLQPGSPSARRRKKNGGSKWQTKWLVLPQNKALRIEFAGRNVKIARERADDEFF